VTRSISLYCASSSLTAPGSSRFLATRATCEQRRPIGTLAAAVAFLPVAEEDAAEARIARAAAASEPITIAEDIASFTQTRVGARTCALSSPPPTRF